MEKKQEIRISYDPIFHDRIDGIFFVQSRVTFVVCKEEECAYPHKTLKLRRFVRISEMGKVKQKVCYAERMMRAMLEGAIECLAQVREIHFEIEKQYMKAMDFEAKENFTKRFCEKVLT